MSAPRAFSAPWSPGMTAAMETLSEDEESGATLLRALAIAGDRNAIEVYAGLLARTTPTTEEAIEWSLKAAAFNSAMATWNLAMIAHERGNRGEVEMWIDRATALGCEDGIEVQRLDYDVEAFLRAMREAD